VVVVDTRPPHEYGICSLPNTTSEQNRSALQLTPDIPLASLLASPEAVPPGRAIFLCRRGNDSQLAAAALRQSGRDATDVRGGLVAWSREIDPRFPLY
jgi:adenylyltransferase/sulfurtransferase